MGMIPAIIGLIFAALLIFYAGKQFGKKRQSRKSAETARRYFKGLSYVLNEEPDKAIDLFVELIKVDSDTVETHFALGNLYRQRGETERAIRIHQNIYNRPALPEAHRSHAQYELGLDYFQAGILDRAETIFSEQLKDNFYRQSALKMLLQLYQKTKEWDKAVAVASELRRELPTDFVPVLAHFYCELAENHLAKRQPDKALAMCAASLEVDGKNVRANLIAAQAHLINGERDAARDSLRAILRQDPTLFSEAIPMLADVCENPDQQEVLLTEAISAGAGASSVLALAEKKRHAQGDRAAGEFLITQLKTRPSLRELHRLVELHVANASGSTKESLQLLGEVLLRLNSEAHRFHCQRCGFHGSQMYWRCPTCKTWNSVNPVTGIVGE